jgi:hypothetical protein
MLTTLQIKFPNYFFQYTKDTQNRLEKVIWISHKMKINYANFGDVVIFDTTFRTNRFKLPLGFFVGISNEGKSIFLEWYC